ncbi:MAG: hypothetical protein IPH59_14355 [bacterium]|nr:hypothetical protein [bacterium]
MLARYQIPPRFHKIPPGDPALKGTRLDTRKNHNYVFCPTPEMVEAYFNDMTPKGWKLFTKNYRRLLQERFETRREEFDKWATVAAESDLFLGCSCPTERNPNLEQCHTWLALEFMQKKYPKLKIEFPRS